MEKYMQFRREKVITCSSKEKKILQAGKKNIDIFGYIKI